MPNRYEMMVLWFWRDKQDSVVPCCVVTERSLRYAAPVWGFQTGAAFFVTAGLITITEAAPACVGHQAAHRVLPNQ